MYIPAPFQLSEAEACDVIKEYGFAALFSTAEGMPYATHLPLMMSKNHECLYGHFALPNPQWKEIDGQNVLAVFQGPHCYISPKWYETNQAVPTWNYVAVHVYGEAELLDEEETVQSMSELVLKYESPDSPYKLEDVDAKLLAGMNKGVKGFKIKISKIEGKAKLSQNHSAARQGLVVQQLKQIPHTNEQLISGLMEENIKRITANN
ncbi:MULTISPECIES: FMN-binding negative transcriptional regulator [Bacillus]|uniref:FMN-binding negative transcriptional regulator n=1 Tax=Bacillus TaxID=1386 RepID=UPI0002B6CAC7|nr:MULTISPECIES: FMN-binding negative transcriptional regulator [Bacillus]AMR49332.1 transcriptional regulator [Bacillus amyloliquefaciens]MCA1215065.1 FMN-binding negative transcriptional regulator [Bacillus amyloliquefaciens]MCB7144285.1 FMN-binding negative transcriptional regulator [Bacillus velezensis]MCC2551989.1 FMN-binding negative transcriptional regulator [Bacillus velezensis]MCC8309940.1 FMN-binding negative transcriptional regulator [Bacillus velezensis]